MKHLQEAGAPAVGRALDLLEILSRSGEGLTLSELSRRLEIPKSTTHYLIHTLAARGYLQRIPWTRQYSLGLRAFDVTSKGADEWKMHGFFSPTIRELAQTMSLGAQIAVLQGDEGMVINRVDFRALPSNTRPGHHFRLHCTAAGKALIAWHSDAALQALFPQKVLNKFTSKTISDFDRLRGHLADVRKKRYAFNDEEYHFDRRAVAVPIFDLTSRSVIASLSVDGSTAEIPIPQIPRIANALLQAAEGISREISAN